MNYLLFASRRKFTVFTYLLHVNHKEIAKRARTQTLSNSPLQHHQTLPMSESQPKQRNDTPTIPKNLLSSPETPGSGQSET